MDPLKRISNGDLGPRRAAFHPISTANLSFYRGLRATVSGIHAEVLPAIQSVFPQLSLKLDHIYIASNSHSTYMQFKDHIRETGGKLIREVLFKDRRLSVLKLPRSLVMSDNSRVIQVEMGEPKPNRPEDTHIAHVAYSISGPNSEEAFGKILDQIEDGDLPIPGREEKLHFIYRDLWGDPPEVVGFKMLFKHFQVEIRISPLR